jgi:large subunit ribosomal protein L7Ae
MNEDKILELIEIAKETGKIKKGANEATKSIEKGEAKLVVYAGDVSPKEVIMHLPLLCKEKNVACIEVKSKEALGASAGLGVGTSAIAVVREGDAKSGIGALVKEVVKEEAPAEEKKEASKEEEKKE